MNIKNNVHKLLGDIGQWLSVLLMATGIWLLIQTHIDIATILFSIGALVDILATKCKYYGEQFITRNNELLKIIAEKERLAALEKEKGRVASETQVQFF
jgi:hypothetical protein